MYVGICGKVDTSYLRTSVLLGRVNMEYGNAAEYNHKKNNFNNSYKTKLNAIEYVYIKNSYKRLQKLQG